ncbi:MAG: transposase, partial [Limnobacter sp.]|nr:transposase [Limnobacter sp.]
HAPTSTKNARKARDPEMHQTRKGNNWYFGMKVHIGADAHSGLVHTVSVTPANTADITELPDLLREDDQAVFGDKAYTSKHYKRHARQAGVFWGVNLKATTKHALTRTNPSARARKQNRKNMP